MAKADGPSAKKQRRVRVLECTREDGNHDATKSATHKATNRKQDATGFKKITALPLALSAFESEQADAESAGTPLERDATDLRGWKSYDNVNLPRTHGYGYAPRFVWFPR